MVDWALQFDRMETRVTNEQIKRAQEARDRAQQRARR